jgi:hypothetical protein
MHALFWTHDSHNWLVGKGKKWGDLRPRPAAPIAECAVLEGSIKAVSGHPSTDRQSHATVIRQCEVSVHGFAYAPVLPPQLMPVLGLAPQLMPVPDFSP